MGLLRRSLELGLGVLVLTKEAADDLVEELVKSDDMERDSARRLIDDMRARGDKLRQEWSESVQRETDAAIRRAGLVRKSDYDALARQVDALERRVSELEGGGFEAATDI